MYSGEDLYGRSVGERARSHYQIGSEGVEVSQPLSSQSSALNEPKNIPLGCVSPSPFKRYLIAQVGVQLFV